jgi:dGTPase
VNPEPASPRATRNADATRTRPVAPDPFRSPFQRDRDRILHTKAFRRLKHKTQVFISPEGDHYRTRLTHTLEVSALSRTVARALDLNEDLVEAVAMGHDIGHAPFGHAGEHALDAILSERFGRRFRHNEHSVRVVEVLERDGRGLNLTTQVVDGIRHHSGPGLPATLEGQIVRLVDRIAYVNHDIEDAVRAGALSADDLPAAELEVLGATGSERLTTLIGDIVETSRSSERIAQSPPVSQAFLRLRKFMFDRVYLGPSAREEAERAKGVVTALFHWLLEHPEQLPAGGETDPVSRVADYVAGMTDRFALRLYRETFMPHEGLL